MSKCIFCEQDGEEMTKMTLSGEFSDGSGREIEFDFAVCPACLQKEKEE